MSSKNFIKLVLIVAIVTGSCRREKFVQDKKENGLPRYSQSGNNVAGALVNDKYWKTYFTIPYNTNIFLLTNHGDHFEFEIRGKQSDGKEVNKVDFKIIIKDKEFILDSIADLLKLSGKMFELDGERNYAIMEDHSKIESGKYKVYSGGKGIFEIKKVREKARVITNKEIWYEFIVAGVFSFSFNETNVKVEQGRFDFQVWNDLFTKK